MYSDILQALLETLITVLVPVLATFAIAGIRVWMTKAQASIPAEQLAFASSLAKEFVKAAEQSGLAGLIADEGREKKAFVISKMEAVLEQKGIKIDMDVISALVESAVYEAVTQSKQEQAPAGEG